MTRVSVAPIAQCDALTCSSWISGSFLTAFVAPERLLFDASLLEMLCFLRKRRCPKALMKVFLIGTSSTMLFDIFFLTWKLFDIGWHRRFLIWFDMNLLCWGNSWIRKSFSVHVRYENFLFWKVMKDTKVLLVGRLTFFVGVGIDPTCLNMKETWTHVNQPNAF